MTAPDAAPHSRVEGKSAGAPGLATPVAASADDQSSLFATCAIYVATPIAWLLLLAWVVGRVVS